MGTRCANTVASSIIEGSSALVAFDAVFYAEVAEKVEIANPL